MIVGCKLLREDGTSLNGKFQYQRNEWLQVPGNGAYVAVTGGLTVGGVGKVLAYFECKEPTGAKAPNGVTCFRRVRWVEDAPERISRKLRGEVARLALGLSPKQRMELAMKSTPELRGEVARLALGLSPEQRIELALKSTPELRGEVAFYAPGLSPQQRMELKGNL